MRSSHTNAILQALLVTFIWSLSWVLIKIGLKGIPPITFAGLRYTLAFLCLLMLAARSPFTRQQIKTLSRQQWRWLLALGVVYYAVTQGAQFAGLVYLPSVTLSLLINFTPVIVALMSVFALAEYPSRQQVFGIGIFILGVLVYFYPVSIPSAQVIGLLIGLIGTVSNAAGSIMGRFINRSSALSPRVVTTVSMGIGGGILLITGLATEGIPSLTLRDLALIVWLAVVHTAFTFTLWNHTLRTLTAVESSVINNTMLVQIALLAWIFLGEDISVQGIAGLAVAVAGILLVQVGGLRAAQRK